MRGFAKLLAVLLLALAPAALTSVAPAQAQPGERRAERQAERRGPIAQAIQKRAAPRQAYPVAPPPAYAASPAGRPYRAPAPAPYPGGYAPPPYAAYPPPPAYAAPPPGAYPYAPPPGYAAAPPPRNSLGADWAQQQNQARQGVRQGRMIPLGQVIQHLRLATPGRLLDAGLESGPNGQPAYRVRWAATGGRRIDFIVDAVTGAVLARTGY